MQASVPSVGQEVAAVRLYGKLLEFPVTSEFAAPGVRLALRLGSIAFGKPGTCFGTLTVDAWLMRFESAL